MDVMKPYIIFDEFINDLQLKQLIKSPYRITSTLATLVDVLVATDQEIISSSGVIDYHHSNHDAIFCKIAVSYFPQLKGT